MKYIITVLIGCLMVACGTKTEKTSEQGKSNTAIEQLVSLTPAQLKNADLQIGNAREVNMHGVIKVNGQVDVPPQSMISVSFPLGGYLKTTHLLPGMGVRKGEVIAILEDQSYVQLQQDYLMAKAKMEFLSTDVQRQKDLSEQEAASKKVYQQVQAEYKTQLVLIRSLEEKLRIVGIDPEKLSVNSISRTINLRSPINGYVTKINVNIGKYVNPSDVLFELVDPDDIHAALTVFEKDILEIKKGMKAKVYVADDPKKQYEVDVILVTRNVDESRSGLVHCHFEHTNHALLPGMFLNGIFELNNHKVWAVPEDAVVRFEGKNYVFIASSDKDFELTPVETGLAQDGLIELKLTNEHNWAQQRVVTKNAYTLLGKLKNKAEED